MSEDKIIKLYSYIAGVVSNNREYEYRPTPSQSRMIDNFIKRLRHNHGDDWLFEYFVFQFFTKHDLNTRFGKGRVFLNWILCRKAMKAFFEASDDRLYAAQQFKFNFELRNPLKESSVVTIDNSIERRRFYNTDRGFMHCSWLNLYRKNSMDCILCKFRIDCSIQERDEIELDKAIESNSKFRVV